MLDPRPQRARHQPPAQPPVARPLRVLHVYKTYTPDTLGGIEQVLLQLTCGLHALGVENRIFTTSPSAQPPVIHRPEADVIRFRSSLDIASTPMSWAAWRAFAAQAAWADVLHFQFPWPFGDLLQVLQSSGKPCVVTYQSDIVRQRHWLRLYRPLMQRFLAQADAVVATSPGYLRSSPVLSALHKPVQVIPNGMDEADLPALPGVLLADWHARVGTGFFFFIGVLRYYKGLHTLLQAAEGFAGQIVIAGDGPERAALAQQAQALGLTNVHFLGQVSDQDKLALLRLCRAFVFPSHLRSEAFGMSLVEAAMQGKPMISCEIGTGTSFVNLHFETGLTVPPEDPSALRSAMQQLQQGDALAARMGAAARKRYEMCFTSRHMALAYHQIYKELQQGKTL